MFYELRTSFTSGSLRFFPLWIPSSESQTFFKNATFILFISSKSEIFFKISYGHSLNVHKQEPIVIQSYNSTLFVWGGQRRS